MTAPDPIDPETTKLIRSRQRSRSVATAVVLVALCALFYAVTIVKIGVWG